MQAKTVLSFFFIGVLVAFVAWGLLWALEDREQVTYGMAGDATTLTLYTGSQETSERVRAQAAEDLNRLSVESSLSLLISSVGDGDPQMIVSDAGCRVAWLNEAGPIGPTDAVLLAGSYSSQLWDDGLRSSFVPAGLEIVGVVRPPSGAGDLQYVRSLSGASELPNGKYVIGSVREADVQEVVDILERSGLQVQTTGTVSLFEQLKQDPLVPVTTGFLTLGLVCSIMQWILLLRGQADEFTIRRRYGARSRDLLRRNLYRSLPAMVSGMVLGVAASGAVVVLTGQRMLDLHQMIALAVAAAAGLVIGGACWTITLTVVLAENLRVRRVA